MLFIFNGLLHFSKINILWSPGSKKIYSVIFSQYFYIVFKEGVCYQNKNQHESPKSAGVPLGEHAFLVYV